MSKPITRIDLEASGEYVRFSMWEAGWHQGDKANITDAKVGSLFYELTELEKQGFTVEMCDATHGRALRGKITRIDFVQPNGRWVVNKYPYGWTAKTRPLTSETKDETFDLESALTWCETHGWTVRRWPGGARAFLGEPMPVRDANTIKRMRRQVDQAMAGLVMGQNAERLHYDLAYDF